MTEITGKSLISGRWLMPGGDRFQSFNPYSGERFNSFRGCGKIEVDAALAAAAQAYRDMQKMTGKQIAGFLNAVADEIELLGEGLLETCDAETGLGLARLTGERGRATGQLRAFAAIAEKGEWVGASIDTAIPDRRPVPKPDLRRMMRGIGPVAVFGASNFPFAFSVPGGDTASALAAGNPVVVKGHPAHPATSELLGHAFERAITRTGFPPGAFSLLQSPGNETGTELVKHPAVQAVGFTGSMRGGRALMDLAAARPHPIPVYAEMGSVNPVFLGPKTLAATGADIAAGLSGSVCMGTGQFCTSPGLAVMVESRDFELKMKEAMDAVPRGYLLNPGIRDALARGLDRLNSIAGVEWLNEAEFETGSMTPPNAVFRVPADVFLQEKRLSEEVFGPVTLLVACRDEAQMLAVAESLDGNLTASIHAGEDPGLEAQLMDLLADKVGRVICNGYPTGVEVCPSQQHGGPYPSSSLSWSTSVGADAIVRFARFVAYQDTPGPLLPDALKNSNPLGIYRRVNGKMTRAAI
ncbi:MAG: aldehyde dehydrogenase (NADP(+)) [Xanthomonadales bacterium]|jgi:NADP-dependent aldehyde dehydrogenase|nr:aldehyde dehydrogenase (NADP(+)) [Xanthomonadales bacterium]